LHQALSRRAASRKRLRIGIRGFRTYRWRARRLSSKTSRYMWWALSSVNVIRINSFRMRRPRGRS